MGYQLDLATFKETFSVNDEGTRLKHSPGKGSNCFPILPTIIAKRLLA